MILINTLTNALLIVVKTDRLTIHRTIKINKKINNFQQIKLVHTN